MASACLRCGCTALAGAGAHALLALLAVDDLDAALELGLLGAHPCPGCSDGCRAILLQAGDARRAALDSRRRFRARALRLQRRQAEREAARKPAAIANAGTPALPTAAADALARALARAKERRG